MITAEELSKLQEFVPYAQKHPHASKGYVVGMRRKTARDELDERDVYLSKHQVMEAIQSRAAGVQGAGDMVAQWRTRADELSENDPMSRRHAMTLRQCAADLAERLATPQPPKDAGEVPMPELERFAHEIVPAEKPYVHMAHDRAGNWCLYRDAIKYGNAREAAGRADAVPVCTCPSGDGSLRHPCPQHPPTEPAARAQVGDLDSVMRARGLPCVSDALGYSRNFAYANPALSQTTRDHIEGLCNMLEIAAANPSPAHAGAEDAEALAEEAAIRCGARVDRARGIYTLTGEQLRAVARRLAGGDHE